MGKVVDQLAANLRRIRRAVSGTQEDFAAASGLSQAQVSRLESGSAWVSLKKLEAAIEQAGGDPSDLLARPESRVSSPDLREIHALLAQADDDAVAIILATLRRLVALEGSGRQIVNK